MPLKDLLSVLVSEAIVRHAPCDVLVVRTEEIPEDFQPEVATPEFRKHIHNSYI